MPGSHGMAPSSSSLEGIALRHKKNKKKINKYTRI
jgi:hypothetical protein